MTIRMHCFEYPVYNFGLHSRGALSCWPKTTLDAQDLERSVFFQQLRSQAFATFQNRIRGLVAYLGAPDAESKLFNGASTSKYSPIPNLPSTA